MHSGKLSCVYKIPKMEAAYLVIHNQYCIAIVFLVPLLGHRGQQLPVCVAAVLAVIG